MLEQVAEVLPELKDRVISLLLMVLFLLLGVAWGVALTAELKCGSSSLTRGALPLDATAAMPQTEGQQR